MGHCRSQTAAELGGIYEREPPRTVLRLQEIHRLDR